MMNALTIVIMISFSFSAGFMFGTFWVVAHKNASHDYEQTDSPSLTRRCGRCGQLFDIEMTDDPENRVCHHCMDILKNDPKDPYWESMNQ